jgi:predicted CoA-binding protein
MSRPLPPDVARFLSGKRFAVAGVSRSPDQPANAVLRKLRASGYEAVPINPNATELEGGPCYPDLASVPGNLDGVIIVTHPAASEQIVRDAAARGIRQIWFHRSFGDGSVSDAAVRACAELGITPIVGGCPLMYCEPIDFGHRCFRWWLSNTKRVPV